MYIFIILIILSVISVLIFIYAGNFASIPSFSSDITNDDVEFQKNESVSTSTFLTDTRGTTTRNFSILHQSENGIFYLKDNEKVYCAINYDPSTETYEKIHPLEMINPKNVSFLAFGVLKDNKSVYNVKFCSKNSIPEIYRIAPDDIDTFRIAIETKEGVIFYDEYSMYFLLPQEYLIEKNDHIDRPSFKFIGYGQERAVNLIEGMSGKTKNAYISDKNGIYVIEFGIIRYVGTSTNFSITEFELNNYEI